jgi:hypothetical protein
MTVLAVDGRPVSMQVHRHAFIVKRPMTVSSASTSTANMESTSTMRADAESEGSGADVEEHVTDKLVSEIVTSLTANAGKRIVRLSHKPASTHETVKTLLPSAAVCLNWRAVTEFSLARADGADSSSLAVVRFAELCKQLTEQSSSNAERLFRELFEKLLDAKRVDTARQLLGSHAMSASSQAVASDARSAFLAALVRTDDVVGACAWFDAMCAHGVARVRDASQLFALLALRGDGQDFSDRLRGVLAYASRHSLPLDGDFWSWFFTVLFASRSSNHIAEVRVVGEGRAETACTR